MPEIIFLGASIDLKVDSESKMKILFEGIKSLEEARKLMIQVKTAVDLLNAGQEIPVEAV